MGNYLQGIDKRIKRLWKREGLNQTEFGAMVGISQKHVSALEAGIRWPSAPLIMCLGFKFGVSEIWLRAGRGALSKAVKAC